MGDRCWLEITIKEKNEQLFKKSFSPESDYGHDSNSLHNKQLSFVYEEANYAFYDELKVLSETSLQFYGNHGPGGTYGPSEFVSDGKEFVSIETGFEGGYVCNFHSNGTPEESTLAEIKKYLSISNKVEQYFNEIETFQTLKCNT